MSSVRAVELTGSMVEAAGSEAASKQQGKVKRYADYEENLLDYTPPKELLERGLSAAQVATLFYEAVYNNNLDVWLATLCESNKTHPAQPTPGGFTSTGWKEGRNKLRKYGTHYQPVASNAMAEVEGCAEGAEVVLEYSPLYGAVPGYTQDGAIGANVRITLTREMDEWRVLKADF